MPEHVIVFIFQTKSNISNNNKHEDKAVEYRIYIETIHRNTVTIYTSWMCDMCQIKHDTAVLPDCLTS